MCLSAPTWSRKTYLIEKLVKSSLPRILFRFISFHCFPIFFFCVRRKEKDFRFTQRRRCRRRTEFAVYVCCVVLFRRQSAQGTVRLRLAVIVDLYQLYIEHSFLAASFDSATQEKLPEQMACKVANRINNVFAQREALSISMIFTSASQPTVHSAQSQHTKNAFKEAHGGRQRYVTTNAYYMH